MHVLAYLTSDGRKMPTEKYLIMDLIHPRDPEDNGLLTVSFKKCLYHCTSMSPGETASTK